MEKSSNYAFPDIHDIMINDEIRTSTYRESIINNKEAFKDKVVVDIGCGTGILSLFAAQAGAKKVYAIECTKIADVAEKIIKDNNFDNIITILRGKSEEIVLPENVDIIISEWMGYSLYYERMLPAVLTIRDRYLKQDGLIFPSHANLYLNIIENPEYRYVKLNSWDCVYDLNFSSFREFLLSRPSVEYMDKTMLISEDCIISSINLHECKAEDMFFESSFSFTANKNTSMDGFMTWFDTSFLDCENKIKLSTSPYTKETHWKSTVFYLLEPIEVHKNDLIEGIICFKPHETEPSALNVEIQFIINGADLKSQNYEFL